MAQTKPLVAAAFLCERVLREEGNVLSAIRIVDTYTTKFVKLGIQQGAEATMPPTDGSVFNASQVLDMNALVIVKAGDVAGRHEVGLAIRNPAGKETNYPEKFPVNFSGKDPAEGAQITARIFMPGDTSPGLYWIDVLWDGEKLTSIPLKLVRESELPETDGE